MAFYIGSTVLNVTDLERGIAFWTAALGYKVKKQDWDFALLGDPHRSWSNLSVQLTDVPKTGLNRLHLDLYASDQMAEVARLEKLGATQPEWEYPPDADFVVMADPDGNEFCIIDGVDQTEEWRDEWSK